jgi:hypothetical protein
MRTAQLRPLDELSLAHEWRERIGAAGSRLSSSRTVANMEL